MSSKMMIFTIAGDEMARLEGFMRDHRRCSDSPHDQYNFIFFPTFGSMIKTVTCCCGQCIDLDTNDE